MKADDDVLIEGLLEVLVPAEPVVRPHLVAAARARIADGEHPSAEALAGRLVDGLVVAARDR